MQIAKMFKMRVTLAKHCRMIATFNKEIRVPKKRKTFYTVYLPESHFIFLNKNIVQMNILKASLFFLTKNNCRKSIF